MREPTIREIEKEYGITFNAKRDMKLSRWLKKNKLKPLAKAVKRICAST